MPNATRTRPVAPPAEPFTVAGAALLAASELRYLSGRVARGEPLPTNASRLFERYARCLEEAAAELRDPITHRPCCRAATNGGRPGPRA